MPSAARYVPRPELYRSRGQYSTFAQTLAPGTSGVDKPNPYLLAPSTTLRILFISTWSAVAVVWNRLVWKQSIVSSCDGDLVGSGDGASRCFVRMSTTRSSRSHVPALDQPPVSRPWPYSMTRSL